MHLHGAVYLAYGAMSGQTHGVEYFIFDTVCDVFIVFLC